MTYVRLFGYPIFFYIVTNVIAVLIIAINASLSTYCKDNFFFDITDFVYYIIIIITSILGLVEASKYPSNNEYNNSELKFVKNIFMIILVVSIILHAYVVIGLYINNNYFVSQCMASAYYYRIYIEVFVILYSFYNMFHIYVKYRVQINNRDPILGFV